MEKIKKYTKKANYSYTLGAFPTIEMINKRPDLVREVYIREDFNEKEELIDLLRKNKIDYSINNKMINRLANKNNVYVVGVFNKFTSRLKDKNHIVLNEVSDMGNMGTIIRTMSGFDLLDLVLIGNVADIYNPKTIRASMGSIFNIRFHHYPTMEAYLEDFPERKLYLFMLSRREEDSIYRQKEEGTYSLVFGNEGSGLPDYYEKYGRKIFIPQSNLIDSFNLPIAVAMGLYEFNRFTKESIDE